MDDEIVDDQPADENELAEEDEQVEEDAEEAEKPDGQIASTVI